MTSNRLSVHTSPPPGDTDTRASQTVSSSFGLASPSTPSKVFDSEPPLSETALPPHGSSQPQTEAPPSSSKLNLTSNFGMEPESSTAGPSREAEGVHEKRLEVRVSSQDLPPSPPLTRTNTAEDTRPGELDITDHQTGEDWHPLKDEERQTHSPAEPNFDSDAEEGIGGSVPRATVFDEEGDSVVDANGRVLAPKSRPGSHLQIEVKQSSPQPWDLVDPPSSHAHEKSRNPYGTVSSHKFSTLQDSARSRSLAPKSSYYFGPPGPDSAYGTPPVGQIGVHHPREILRVERDYTGGELIQFAPIYPVELDGRITPTQFLESINAINELLISAHSLRHTVLDNVLAVFTLQLSRLLSTSHYEKEMRCLQQLFEDLNVEVFNPAGLNLLWPRKVAFLFLEIEYY